ncbi:MAG: ribose 5-phosphate isomerase A [Ignavibacteria bacterium GWB2_35_6b]|nr:MAG: ribose 5-phosphate isomerase A [Ignavibacteria bacterium GWB2_35_6b]
MTKSEEQKKIVGEKAVEYVKSGMILGLGTGSTAYYATLKIGELYKSGELKNIKCIPSSIQTENLAKELSIPLTDFNIHQEIDITIDGADEIDESLNLIKGGGGALLREKVIAQSSKRLIIVADESKLSEKLGSKWHVPIEVIPFAVGVEIKYLKSLGAKIEIRKTVNGEIFRTDENNFILDANFGVINNPGQLEFLLNRRAGIVENGLFIGLTNRVIVIKNNELLELT